MSSEKPPTIEQKIREYQKEIADGDPKGLGPKLQAAAVKAIYAGFGKEDWNSYMKFFASTKKQLQRLTTTDLDACHEYIPQARAYLVVNSMCLPGTNTTMMQGIDDYLDRTLDEAPAPTSARKA
jgi:hypothetical protein